MSMSPSPPDRERGGSSAYPPEMRASDSDRDRVAEVLREAAGDGRLTLEELQERLVVLVRRALDLIDLAVDASPDLREFGTDLHDDATTILADVDVELANLRQAIEALHP